MAANEPDERWPHIQITGGPDPASLKIYRDGKLMPSIVEFQINGGNDAPVTAIFKEIVTFDGSVDVFPRRKPD